jgi:hypothetical protein
MAMTQHLYQQYQSMLAQQMALQQQLISQQTGAANNG